MGVPGLWDVGLTPKIIAESQLTSTDLTTSSDPSFIIILSKRSSISKQKQSPSINNRHRRIVRPSLLSLCPTRSTDRGRIWIFHAQVPTTGENPFLRTIFFKITSLLQQPVLPVFVFDGPDKPLFKRNQKVGGSFGVSDSRSRLFKELLDECGLEWWNVSSRNEDDLRMRYSG